MTTSFLEIRFALGAGAVMAAVVLSAGCNADDRCGTGTVEVDGACVPEDGSCPPGTVEVEGECVPDGSVICGTGTTFNEETGTCDPDISGCAEGTVLVEGECVREEDVRAGDVEEAPEPNDALLPDDGFAAFDLPAVGEDILIEGCIVPYRDVDPVDGEQDPDFDAFVFEAAGPALLDITVDGVGGAAGGFQMVPAGAALAADGWVRFGINLTGDAVQQQVFLPAAGTYVFLAADSRSVLTDLAAGGPQACYFATIANVGIPAATPLDGGAGDAVLGGDVQFWSYDPAADGEIIESAVDYTSETAAAALVEMVDGEYRGSTPFVTFGVAAEASLASLAADDEVVLVVEPITNFSLQPVQTSLTVGTIPTVALPGDGTAVTLTHDDDAPINFVFFQADAGDVVRLEFDPGAAQYNILLYPPGVTSFDLVDEQAIAQVCDECTGADTWVQVQETGFYYMTVASGSAADGEDYDVGFTITRDTPALLEPGAPEPGSLAGADRDFFEASLEDLVWLEFSIVPTGFTDARVRFYPRDAAGQLDLLVPAQDEAIASAGTPFGRIVDGSDATLLVSVENAAGDVGGEAFAFVMAPRPFVDAGIVDDGSPIALPDIPLAAGQPALVLLRGGAGDSVRVTAQDEGGADLVLEQLDRVENSLFARDVGGAGAEENLARVLGDEAFVALRVTAAGGAAGSFDLGAAVVTLEESAGARTPALDIPDAAPIGVTDVASLADPCTIAAVSVDVDISHTFRGDVRLVLTGPSGTTVLLKEDAFDPDEDVVGNFPTTLEPVESLDAFAGEEGSGDWTLTAADVALFDVGTVNAWGVNLLCM
jgi:subtilisin-like proprotein convertase family protein